MHEGINVGRDEPCLVGIERILFVLTVDGDKTLMILTVLTALGSCIRAEVKHIPNVSGPDIFSRKELTDERFVVDRLIFFGVISAFGIRVMPIKRFAAVFRATNGLVRIFFVELIVPSSILVKASAVPTEIMVVGYHVGDVNVLFINIAHGDTSYRCGTGLVHLVNKVVELVMVGDQIGIFRAVHRDLVRKSPNTD